MDTNAYASLGRIGIVTPQANPTAEAEVGLLLPARVGLAVARCVSQGEPRQRLLDYHQGLGDTLTRFDSMPLNAVGFACTGSSYLVGHEAEKRDLGELERVFQRPLISAAQAIDAALQALGARRVALACPYPQWLFEASRNYWSSRGYEVVAGGSLQPDTTDTRSIYALDYAGTADAIREIFARADADVHLITGTGMPSLRLLAELSSEGHVILTSNLCLAWRCLHRGGIPLNEREPEGAFPLLGGWADEVKRL